MVMRHSILILSALIKKQKQQQHKPITADTEIVLVEKEKTYLTQSNLSG